MVRSLGEVAKEIDRLVEEGRKFLPLFRGGTGTGKVKLPPKRKPDGQLPRVKVMQPAEQAELQARLDEQSQIFIGPALPPPPQEMIEMPTNREIDRELIEFLDSQDQPESAAEEIYLVAEKTQNQALEDSLARVEGRRPRRFGRQFERQNLVPAPKKKKKVSAYSKRFGIELKKLKKLHPRTKISALMKRAHRRTRAAMKKK